MIYSSKKIGIKDGKLKNLPSPGGRGLRGGERNGGCTTLTPALSRQGRGEKKFFLMLLLFTFILASSSHSANLNVKDEVGREVTFPFPPTRIVSLAPNVTEILFGLGLDEEIVGVSIHCNFPEKAKRKVRVGSYISLDFEKIASLNPDLIIATGAGNTRDMVDRLGKLGFQTYVIYPKNFKDILQSIAHIGQVVNRGKRSEGDHRRNEKEE